MIYFINNYDAGLKLFSDGNFILILLRNLTYTLESGGIHNAGIPVQFLYEAAVDWIERAKDNLRSESSRKMLSIIEHSDPNEWWKKLKDRK